MFKNGGMAWVTVVVGAWLVVAPFSLSYAERTTRAAVSDAVAGVTIGALSTWLNAGGRLASAGCVLLIGVGLWMLAAPLVVDFRHVIVPLVNDVVVGLLIIAIDLVQATLVTRRT